MKILIIEDELELAKSIASYLSEQQYLCEFAPTLQDAQDKIQLLQLIIILKIISIFFPFIFKIPKVSMQQEYSFRKRYSRNMGYSGYLGRRNPIFSQPFIHTF